MFPFILSVQTIRSYASVRFKPLRFRHPIYLSAYIFHILSPISLVAGKGQDMAVNVVRVAMALGVHHGALGPIGGGLDALSGQIGLDHVPVLCIHGKVAGNSALFKNREYYGDILRMERWVSSGGRTGREKPPFLLIANPPAGTPIHLRMLPTT